MKKLIIIPFLVISLTCHSATYYVAKTGDNGNVGTEASPWLTVNYGVGKLIAGDTLFVRTGTYTERIYRSPTSSDGTASDPIVVMNYGGESPVIDGTGISLGAGSCLLQITTAYFYIIGFEIQNANILGIYDGGHGIGLYDNYNKISNCVVHDTWRSGIIIRSDSAIVEYCTVYNCAMSNSDGIWQREEGETWGAGIVIAGVESHPVEEPIIRNCIIHDIWGEGTDPGTSVNAIVEDNVIYDTYSASLYLMNAIGMLVQRNLIYNTKTMGDGSMVGIYHSNESWFEGNENANNSIINNIVYGRRRNLYVGASATINLLVANNTFVNSLYNYCVQINTIGSTGNFRNNVIIQEDGLSCIYVGASSGLTFSNNLYNEVYDVDAVGVDDEVSVAHISKVGTYSDTSYYRLVSESPAIGGGYDLSGTFTDDYEGTARGVAFDIGALEYAAPDPPLDPILADVETYRPVWATATTATTGGNVIDDGGGTISVRGVCWNTTGEPNIDDDDYTEDGSGTGIFSSTMTGLARGTTYYVRAYATNETGTGYGEEMTFRIKYFFHDGKILTNGGKVLYID